MHDLKHARRTATGRQWHHWGDMQPGAPDPRAEQTRNEQAWHICIDLFIYICIPAWPKLVSFMLIWRLWLWLAVCTLMVCYSCLWVVTVPGFSILDHFFGLPVWNFCFWIPCLRFLLWGPLSGMHGFGMHSWFWIGFLVLDSLFWIFNFEPWFPLWLSDSPIKCSLIFFDVLTRFNEMRTILWCRAPFLEFTDFIDWFTVISKIYLSKNPSK